MAPPKTISMGKLKTALLAGACAAALGLRAVSGAELPSDLKPVAAAATPASRAPETPSTDRLDAVEQAEWLASHPAQKGAGTAEWSLGVVIAAVILILIIA